MEALARNPRFDCTTLLPKIQCRKCPFGAPTLVQLKEHAFKGHREPPEPPTFTCNKCNFTTYSWCIKMIHGRTCKAKNLKFPPLECKKCLFKARSSKGLKLHLKNHKSKPFSCKICGFKAKNWTGFCVHNRRHKNKTSGPFNCALCPYHSLNKRNFIQHVRYKHSTSLNYLCEHCSSQFKSETSLKIHKLARHTALDDVTWLHCPHCPFRTKYKSCLTPHLVKVHKLGEIKWFNCEHCDFRGKSKNALTRHVEVKHEIEWFECDKCQYKGKSSRYLKKHQFYMHGDETEAKWFSCRHCFYRSRFLWNVKKHEVIHSVVK